MTGYSERLRGVIKKYGRTALGTYLTIHAATFTGCYLAVESQLDVRGILTDWGLLSVPTNDDTATLKENERWYDHYLSGKGSTLALAFLCSKALVPVKVPLAVTLTPTVHKSLQRLGVIASKR